MSHQTGNSRPFFETCADPTFGKEWHYAARGKNKFKAYEDFIAGAEYLISEGITTPSQLALIGGSSGGLMVANVINRRPDLFSAAVASRGTIEMVF